jgi:hypothetical protein
LKEVLTLVIQVDKKPGQGRWESLDDQALAKTENNKEQQ